MQVVTGGTESTGSGPFLLVGFVQLIQEATANLRLRITYREVLSRAFGNNIEVNVRLVMLEKIEERILRVAAERDNLLLQLNTFMGSKEDLELKLSKQDFILK